MAGQAGTHRYLVCNAAEGEPGTFKDRALMRANPYQLVEGVIIAASAVAAREAFICLKDSFTAEFEAVTRATAEIQQAGICTDCEITVVSGPDEYLYGEEKAMLEVIEGRDPLPRLFPPYQQGLFATSPQTGWEVATAHPSDRLIDLLPRLNACGEGRALVVDDSDLVGIVTQTDVSRAPEVDRRLEELADLAPR